MAKKQAKSSGGGALIGLAALAAVAAGGYFLYGKDGAKNRKKVKGWMLKAKGEVLEKVEKLKEVSEPEYRKVVDAVTAKYAAVKSIDPAEVQQMAKELHGHWKNIKRSIAPAPAKKKTAAKKSSAKKTVPKQSKA